jgi:hypothetical protein
MSHRAPNATWITDILANMLFIRKSLHFTLNDLAGKRQRESGNRAHKRIVGLTAAANERGGTVMQAPLHSWKELVWPRESYDGKHETPHTSAFGCSE